MSDFPGSEEKADAIVPLRRGGLNLNFLSHLPSRVIPLMCHKLLCRGVKESLLEVIHCCYKVITMTPS